MIIWKLNCMNWRMQRELTYGELCNRLREYYDGYHFTYNSIGIYNPFSLLNTFKYREFGSYWFETGELLLI